MVGACTCVNINTNGTRLRGCMWGPKFIAGLTIVQRRWWCRGRIDSDAGFDVGVDVDASPLLVREAPIKPVEIGLIEI